VEERPKLKQLIEDERYINYGYDNDIEEVISIGEAFDRNSVNFL